jgi:photosystem II stability/assembly factor-like uncharacterized protein
MRPAHLASPFVAAYDERFCDAAHDARFRVAGFLLGTRQTLLETFDAGKTWEPRVVEAAEDEGINYRYNSVSFFGDEGYLIGKPGTPPSRQ